MGERDVDEDCGQIISTNMRRELLRVNRSAAGVARYGFSRVEIEEEPLLMASVLNSLRSVGSYAPDLKAATLRIQSYGLSPYYLTLPYGKVEEFCGIKRDAAESAMASQGYAAEVAGGLRVLMADVACPFLTAHPGFTGFYTRSDDMLGLMLLRTDSAWCIVGL